MSATDPSTVPNFTDVYRTEIDREIVGRRRVVGLLAPATDDEQNKSQTKAVKRSLVGLAMSGGGWRSAAFSLGVAQALLKRGFFGRLDYLSTVSGGGYAGSLISSLASAVDKDAGARMLDPALAVADDGDAPRETRRLSELKQQLVGDEKRDNGSQQTDIVRSISLSGLRLNRPVEFFCAWAIGVLLVNVVVLSGLFALMALAAWLFRQTDQPMAIAFIDAMGFSGDVMRALFPAFIAALLWLGSAGIGYVARTPPGFVKVTRVLFIISLILLAMGVAVMIGSGDIDFGPFYRGLGIERPQESQSVTLTSKIGLGIALLVAMAPILRPSLLIRSGVAPKSFLDRWVFSIASWAILCGIPLFVFGILARENISHFEPARPMGDLDFVGKPLSPIDAKFLLAPGNIGAWDDFWDRVDSEKPSLGRPWIFRGVTSRDRAGAHEIDRKLRAIVTKALLNAQLPIGDDGRAAMSVKEALVKDRESADEIARNDRHWMIRRWLLDLPTIWSSDSSLRARTRHRFESDRLRDRIVAAINRDILCNVKFTESVFPLVASLAGVEPNRMAGQGTADPAAARVLTDNLLASPAATVIISARPFDWFEHLYFDFPDRMQHDRWNRRVMDSIFSGDGNWWRVDPNRALLVDTKDKEDDGAQPQVSASLRQFNLGVLNLLYPTSLRAPSTVFSRVVFTHDQEHRLFVALWSLGVFVVAAIFVDLNASSIQRYYREKLSQTWLTQGQDSMDRPLASLENCAHGAPYHLLCAMTAGPRSRNTASPEFPKAHFLLSKLYCGAFHFGFHPTRKFGGGAFELSDAMAISGAAVTPDASDNLLVRAIIFITNWRMGEFVALHGSTRKWYDPRSLVAAMPFGLLRVVLGHGRDVAFISDGGVYENLGIGPLLARRCRLIICADAGADPHGDGVELLELIQRSEARHGIRIEQIPDPGAQSKRRWLDELIVEEMENAEADRSDGWGSLFGRKPVARRALPKSSKHYLVFKITYPKRTRHKLDDDDCLWGEDNPGYLVYLKPTFADGDEPISLCGFAMRNAEFPHDSTVNLFYEPYRFVAYRSLGEHIGEKVCDELNDKAMGEILKGRWRLGQKVETSEDPFDGTVKAFQAIVDLYRDGKIKAPEVMEGLTNVEQALEREDHRGQKKTLARLLIELVRTARRGDDLNVVIEVIEALGMLKTNGVTALLELLTEPALGDGDMPDEKRGQGEVRLAAACRLLDAMKHRRFRSSVDVETIAKYLPSISAEDESLAEAMVFLLGVVGLDQTKRNEVKAALAAIESGNLSMNVKSLSRKINHRLRKDPREEWRESILERLGR